jgi:hypothetical protein
MFSEVFLKSKEVLHPPKIKENLGVRETTLKKLLKTFPKFSD